MLASPACAGHPECSGPLGNRAGGGVRGGGRFVRGTRVRGQDDGLVVSPRPEGGLPLGELVVKGEFL